MRDVLLKAVQFHLGVNPACHLPEREFSQRVQVRLLKEVLHGALCLLRYVDLAGAESSQQILRRQVDEFDFVGRLESTVRNRLFHDHASHLPDDIVQAVDVLNVESCPDIDAGPQKLLHILPAFGMP